MHISSIAVAIVNYNTREHLRACLATVAAEGPSEVVVVDNASSDGDVELVRVDYPHVMFHANEKNIGYGAAANQAMASCRAKYVLLLNADTLLQPGALRALSAYLDQHPRAAVVGPRLVDPDGTLQASCYPFPTPLNTFLENSTIAVLLGRRIRRQLPALGRVYFRTWSHDHARNVPWVKGAALAIRREAFEAIGGFDESFFMYFEDTDLCYRLHAVGWQVHFTPSTTVVHVGGASTAKYRTDMATQQIASTLQFYHRHSSRLRFIGVVTILKMMMLAKWICGTLALFLTCDTEKRNKIVEDIATSRRFLLGGWYGQDARNAAHRSSALVSTNSETGYPTVKLRE